MTGTVYDGRRDSDVEWVNDAWVQFLAFIVAATVAALALKKFWQVVLVPLWAAMKAAVKLTEIHRTVSAIHDEFRENGGTSLHDHITTLTRGQEELRDEVAEVRNLVEIHIASTIRGGRRYSDPQ